MMGMAAALLYNVVELTKKYFSYPISVKLSVDHQQELAFPSVTVCNMSPIKKSSLKAAQQSTAAATKRRKKRSSMTARSLAQYIHFLIMSTVHSNNSNKVFHNMTTCKLAKIKANWLIIGTLINHK